MWWVQLAISTLPAASGSGHADQCITQCFCCGIACPEFESYCEKSQLLLIKARTYQEKANSYQSEVTFSPSPAFGANSSGHAGQQRAFGVHHTREEVLRRRGTHTVSVTAYPQSQSQPAHGDWHSLRHSLHHRTRTRLWNTYSLCQLSDLDRSLNCPGGACPLMQIYLPLLPRLCRGPRSGQ